MGYRVVVGSDLAGFEYKELIKAEDERDAVAAHLEE